MAGYMNTSERSDWETPRKLFEELDEEFGFTLDAASSDANAKCEKHYTAEENSLGKPWGGSVFSATLLTASR